MTIASPMTLKKRILAVSCSKLLEATRRYKNARRRALYWSGTPCFSRAARSQECRSYILDEKYSLAICDCKTWERIIGNLTGKPVKPYNPKHRFSEKMPAMLKASNAELSRAGDNPKR